MDEERFWALISETKASARGDLDAQANALVDRLAELPPADIATFDRIWRQHSVAAYRWDLWAAAYVINGGCSDDCFDYFRDYLIALGREVYDRALQDPDTLVDVAQPEEEVVWEQVSYVRDHAYERATGRELPVTGPFPDEPEGEPWEEEDLPSIVPQLYEKFAA